MVPRVSRDELCYLTKLFAMPYERQPTQSTLLFPRWIDVPSGLGERKVSNKREALYEIYCGLLHKFHGELESSEEIGQDAAELQTIIEVITYYVNAHERQRPFSFAKTKIDVNSPYYENVDHLWNVIRRYCTSISSAQKFYS